MAWAGAVTTRVQVQTRNLVHGLVHASPPHDKEVRSSCLAMFLALTQQITPLSLSQLLRAPSSQKIDLSQSATACGIVRYGDSNVRLFPPHHLPKM